MSARGGGKFFRAPPASNDIFHSDNDDDSDDDSHDNNNQHTHTSSSKNRNARNLSDSESEESDEESEDEEEEEEAPRSSKNEKRKKHKSSSKKQKAKKPKMNFFDEEAEVDTSDEEDSEEEVYGAHHDPHDVVKKHYTEEDKKREYQGEEFNAISRQIDRRRQQAGGVFAANLSVEEVTRQVENRHLMSRRTVDRDVMDRLDSDVVEGSGVTQQAFTAVSQQSLLPSVNDPSLWMFSCPNGKEQELVCQIMNKCISYARMGKPLGITSAVAAQSKGKVYVESYSEPTLIQAIQGIRNIMSYTMTLIPIQDMTTVMTVVPKKKPVKRNDWVRMTRGHFKGDLALVKDIRDGGLKCVIQCVPRLDLTLADLSPEEAKIRRRTVRPPQKFFNPEDITALKREFVRQRFPISNEICDYFEGNYYHDGYLLKEVTVGTMIKPCTEDDPPTLDELQRFRQRKKANNEDYDDANDEDENEGSRQAGSLLDELSDISGPTMTSKGGHGRLIIGDTVEVMEGDLVGMRGKLISIDGTTVKVQPDSQTADLGGMKEVEFLASQVRKHIPIGAHVKVIDGRYANETGTVVTVEKLEGDSDFTAVVLTDMTHKEVSVRVSQLQESAEIASGQDRLAGYELHDLVVLTGGGSANEVGVIVRVGREEFTVMNHHGIVREVRPEDLRGKRNASSGRAVALDVQGNQIRVGDNVSVAEGPHKGKTATIKRMNRAQLFLYSQTRLEHAGIFVVRSRSCVLSGSRSQNRASADQSGMSPYNTPRTQAGGGGGRGRRDDTLIQKTVRIQSGKWKGYMGCVSDATPTHVQVELHSRLKKIMVLRDRVAVIGDKFGATDNPDRSNHTIGAPTTPFMGGATPMHGGATPMHGGATPMHESGGYTPSHHSAGLSDSTDVWRPSMDSGNDASDAGSAWGSTIDNDKASDIHSFATSDNESRTGNTGWGSTSPNDQGNTWTPSTSAPATTTPASSVNGNFNGDSSFANGGDSSSQLEDQNQNSNHNDTTTSKVMGEHTDASDSVPVWFMERVCVTVQTNNNAEGTIKMLHENATATVTLLDDRSDVKVKHSDLTLVKPSEHDTVLVTGGVDVGVEGELVCIDGSDAILKDAGEDYKIVDFAHLAKIHEL